MAIITFYPLVFQVWMAFTDFQLKNLRPTAPGPNIVGLDNFARILNNNIVIPNFDFLRVLTFNLFWAFTNVVIHVVLGVAIALVLNVDGLKFKRFWRALYILPIAIPPIIVATVWRNMFDPQYGAINQGINGVVGVLLEGPAVPPRLAQRAEPDPGRGAARPAARVLRPASRRTSGSAGR